MGKNQHSKDRMFITATEHAGLYGGYKKKKTVGLTGALPFDCCALSLLPFDSPVCARDGILFDALQLLPYVQEKGVSPATGKKLSVKDVLRLKMAKNQDNQWHCPVTCKVFTNHSKVVCIATTGNVFSKDAVKELCFKMNCLEDLLDATPFKKEDVISLHDPDDKDLVRRRDLANFWHLQEERKRRDAELGTKGSFKQTDAQKEVLAEARKNVQEREAQRLAKEKARQEALNAPDRPENKGLTEAYLRVRQLGATTDEVTPGSKLTSGATSGSFTSSAMDRSTTAALRAASDDELKTARWKVLRSLGQKGYARIRTSLGDLNVEIHCDMVPRAAENFLGLCRDGKYDDTLFHRVVRHFVAQGGDPTGTGRGGDSLWGAPFADEFDSRLTHSERGVLAYANDGRDRNKQQFYVTFKSCGHLDNKHTVFGRVVGGHDVLDRIERVDVDAADDHRPLKDGVKILGTDVFVDPTTEADAKFEGDLRAKIAARADSASPGLRALPVAAPAPPTKRPADDRLPVATERPKPKKARPYGDFSGW